MQSILVYVVFAGAISYFAYAYLPFFKKKKANKSCGGDSCGC